MAPPTAFSVTYRIIRSLMDAQPPLRATLGPCVGARPYL